MIDTQKLLRKAIFDAANPPKMNPDDEGDDFDPEEEFEAAEPCDENGNDSGDALDGDFKGHPFRGNAAVKVSREGGAAIHASRRAKHAELKGDKKAIKSAHKAAYFSHAAAAEVATTKKSKKYHQIMSKFHGERAGV